MAWNVKLNNAKLDSKFGAPLYDSLVPVDMVSKSVINNAAISSKVLAAALKAGIAGESTLIIERDDKVLVTSTLKAALDYTAAIALVKADFDKVTASLSKVKAYGIERVKVASDPKDADSLASDFVKLLATSAAPAKAAK